MGNTTRVLILACLLFLCASQAFAEFTLTKGITLRQEYNDNVDLDAEDEEDDFITTITPRVGLTWSVRDFLDLSLSLTLDIREYWKNTDKDTFDLNANAAEASRLDATFNIYREIVFLRIADTFSRVTIDEGEKGGMDNVTNQTDSNLLVINPYLQFAPRSDLQFKLGYSYENQWYSDEDGDDAENHIFDLAITKVLTERVSATLSGSRRLFRPKNPSERRYLFGENQGTYEYDQDSVRFGLSYQVSEKLQIAGGYGHTWLDYDVREDTDSDTWDASADYEISSTVTTGVAYRLDYTVSVEDGPSEQEYLSAYIAYDDRMQIRLSVFTTTEDYVEINRQNDSYGGNLSGTLPLNDRFGLNWGLSYANYDESSSDLRLERITIPLPPNSVLPGDSITIIIPRVIDTSEEYDRYGVNLALYYDIPLGQISTGWVWTRNESDLDDEDYTNNIIYVQASRTF